MTTIIRHPKGHPAPNPIHSQATDARPPHQAPAITNLSSGNDSQLGATPPSLLDLADSPAPVDLYEQGYDAAARELLANLVWMAEDFLSARQNPTAADRKMLYGFVAMLEKRLCRMQSEAGVVEGGLGI